MRNIFSIMNKIHNNKNKFGFFQPKFWIPLIGLFIISFNVIVVELALLSIKSSLIFFLFLCFSGVIVIGLIEINKILILFLKDLIDEL